MADPAQAPSGVAPGAARLAIGIASMPPGVAAEIEAQLTHRFESEFGPIDETWRERPQSGTASYWLLFQAWIDPTRLATIQSHLRRVGELCRTIQPWPVRVDLEAALVDRHRVVRAFDTDAPCRVQLAGDVWAAVEMQWGEGSKPGWTALSWTPQAWLTTAGRDFWTRAREHPQCPPSAVLI